eukprot:COSAG04_NODE_9472_length_861_cov_0.904199_1_plen_66_part_10
MEVAISPALDEAERRFASKLFAAARWDASLPPPRSEEAASRLEQRREQRHADELARLQAELVRRTR